MNLKPFIPAAAAAAPAAPALAPLLAAALPVLIPVAIGAAFGLAVRAAREAKARREAAEALATEEGRHATISARWAALRAKWPREDGAAVPAPDIEHPGEGEDLDVASPETAVWDPIDADAEDGRELALVGTPCALATGSAGGRRIGPANGHVITRETLRELLADGPQTRADVLAALGAMGFKKTAAYSATAAGGRFADVLAVDAGGRLIWNGGD